jgi:hypothetical protein
MRGFAAENFTSRRPICNENCGEVMHGSSKEYRIMNINILSRRLLTASLVLLLAAVPGISQAQRHGGGGHWHGHGGGWGWGPRVGISLGIGVPLWYSSPYAYDPYYYGYPRTVVVAPAVTYADPGMPAPAVASPAMPDPVIYPRNGQTPEQTEADMRACNAWATSQPKAMADASVFHRATAACMDGRGYSLR